jgi:hypothetical protein
MYKNEKKWPSYVQPLAWCRPDSRTLVQQMTEELRELLS